MPDQCSHSSVVSENFQQQPLTEVADKLSFPKLALSSMLPPGVSIPPTMDLSILIKSDRALTLLRELSPSQSNAALLEFVEAMKMKGERVRNSQAYLVGVIKRYITFVQGNDPTSHYNPTFGKTIGPTPPRSVYGQGSGMGDQITPVVKNSLETLINSGFCTFHDLINEKVMDKLSLLSEKDALHAINEISGCKRDKIRNFTSYFIGILNRNLRGEETFQQNEQLVFSSRHESDGRRSLKDRRHRIFYHLRHSRSRSASNRHRDNKSDSDYNDRSYRRHGADRNHRRKVVDDFSHSSLDYDNRRLRDRNRSRSMEKYERQRYRDRHRDRRRGYSYLALSRSRSRSSCYRRETYRHYESFPLFDKGPRSGNERTVGVIPIYGQNPSRLGIPPPPPSHALSHDHRENVIQQQPWLKINQPFTSPIKKSAHNITTHLFPMHHGINGNFGNGIAPLMKNPNLGPPPSDILGIAEKASAAVQQLTAQNMMNRQPVSHHHQQLYNEPHYRGSVYGIKDFSVMVQMAIKNLTITGHLDSSKVLGPLACRLLRQLPEPIALKSLENFSACDTSIMRSKEGYLVGILKKALGRL